MSNVPDDWGNYYTTCAEGHRFHASEGDCGVCVTCSDCDDKTATDTDDLCDDCREAREEAKCVDCDDTEDTDKVTDTVGQSLCRRCVGLAWIEDNPLEAIKATLPTDPPYGGYVREVFKKWQEEQRKNEAQT